MIMTPASDQAPLRLCFLTPDHPSHGLNGPTRDALHTGQALAALGHEVHVVGYGESTTAGVPVDGVWRHHVSMNDQTLPDLADVPVATDLYAAVAKYRAVMRLHARAPLHLVVATPWPGESLVCLLDRRLTVLTRLVTSVKFMTDTGLLRGEPWLSMGRLERAVISRSRHFSASTAAIVADTESTFQIKLPAIAPVPLGTADRAREVTHGERLASPEEVVVLSVGRLEPRKGADVLLASARLLVTELPHALYVFVGEGNWDGLRMEVERDVQLRGRVLFLGRVDDARLWRLYAGADLVCVPSLYESFGQVLIEAMMFGKPIVASAAGGMPSVVEEGGNALLASPGDCDQLASCLRELISSPELRRSFGRRSRELYEERYTLERVGARKAEHFRSILETERAFRAETATGPGSILVGLAEAVAEITGKPPAVAARIAAGLLDLGSE
jgi:glycogen(starch) synthase